MPTHTGGLAQVATAAQHQRGQDPDRHPDPSHVASGRRDAAPFAAPAAIGDAGSGGVFVIRRRLDRVVGLCRRVVVRSGLRCRALLRRRSLACCAELDDLGLGLADGARRIAKRRGPTFGRRPARAVLATDVQLYPRLLRRPLGARPRGPCQEIAARDQPLRAPAPPRPVELAKLLTGVDLHATPAVVALVVRVAAREHTLSADLPAIAGGAVRGCLGNARGPRVTGDAHLSFGTALRWRRYRVGVGDARDQTAHE